jgi:hypothetical protein
VLGEFDHKNKQQMKVFELINELKKCDPNAEIAMPVGSTMKYVANNRVSELHETAIDDNTGEVKSMNCVLLLHGGYVESPLTSKMGIEANSFQFAPLDISSLWVSDKTS